MDQNSIPDWLSLLSDEHLLAVYDVALDIRDELPTGDEVFIPIYRQVARFAPLCPGFSVAFVDRYCELRSEAAMLLKRQAVIVDLDVARGPYRWDGHLKIRIEPETFLRHFRAVEQIYQVRFKENAAGRGSLSGAITNDPLELLRSILSRFHVAAARILERHGNRPTLAVADEFDVRDLLRALISIYFDDITPMGWTPGYSGGPPRAGFHLRHEKIVVAVRMTGAGLGARELAEQIRIDKEHYAKTGGCDTLVCFVYDPQSRIGNPARLESELSESKGGFRVDVVITPKQC